MVAQSVFRSNAFLSKAATKAFALFCALSLSVSAAAAERPIEVGFLAGGSAESEFWSSMGRFAAAVAEDLNIDLRIVYPGEDTFEKDGEAHVSSLSKDAYLITAYVDPISGRLLEAANARGIRTLLINTAVLEADRERIGKPRQRLQRWIGHMQPDDVQAGYEVADLLIRRFAKSGATRMIAINGNNNLPSDQDRRRGLERRLTQSEGALLYETKEGMWSEANARKIAIDLLRKYPQTNAIWAASDSMALGAVAAVREIGKQPGRDIVVAGIDWTRKGLDSVRAGDLSGSVGSHFMEAGLALLLIHDYHHGRDFAEELGVSFQTPMTALSQEDAASHLDTAGRTPDWARVDFKQLTKTHNAALKRYDFSWERIADQL